MSEAAAAVAAEAPAAPAGAGRRAVRLVFYALVLWIPVETFYVFNSEAASSDRISISRILGMILFGLALIEWRWCFRRLPFAFWLVGCYLSLRMASLLWIPRFLDARFKANMMTLLQMSALFLISINIFGDTRFRQSVLRAYGWWVSLVSVGMVTGLLISPWTGIEGRNSLLDLDPNVAAGFFGLAAVCLGGDPALFGSRYFGLHLAATLAALSSLIIAILQTGSRGGLLALIAGVLGLGFCGRPDTFRRRMAVFAAVAAGLGLLILREFAMNTATAARLMNTWNTGDTAGRNFIYDAAWAMFWEKPLMGFGGANNFYTLGVRLGFSTNGNFIRDTHNLLLMLLTEVGLVGTIPFMAALAYAGWTAWVHGRRTGDAVPFALMCVLVTINGSITGYEQKLFWIVFAAAVACGAGRRARPKEAHVQ